MPMLLLMMMMRAARAGAGDATHFITRTPYRLLIVKVNDDFRFCSEYSVTGSQIEPEISSNYFPVRLVVVTNH